MKRIMPLTSCVVFAFFITSQWPVSAAEIALRVTDSSGNAVSDATTAIVPAGRTVFVTDGLTLDEDPNYVLGKTDDAGAVQLKTDAADFLLLVVHERGYAKLDRDTAMKTKNLTLTKWGRIEGQMRIGDKPAANVPVQTWAALEKDGMPGAEVPGWYFSSDGTTDANGDFAIDRVPAERVSVASKHKYWDFTSYPRPLRLVDVKPGETSHVTLGGTGRPVVGKINMPESVTSVDGWQFVYCMLEPVVPEVPAPMPEAMKGKSLQEQATWWQSFRGSDAERAYRAEQRKGYTIAWQHTYPFDVAKDGTFRIEDVSPGKYKLSLVAMVPFREGRPGKDLGATTVDITVEPFTGERTAEVQTLPPIEWKVDEGQQVEIGDMAPDFSVPAFDGSTIKLADYRGKYVVLDFWATWCGPCIAELPNLIAARRQFTSDDRIVFIGLSLDNEPDAPIEFIAREKLDWTQGYLGKWDDDKVTKAYGVGGIPSLWLIGPDGKVVARGLRGEEVMTKITEALNPNAASKPSTAESIAP